MEKREVDLVIISDVHMGTYGCHAQELLRYLKTVKPGKLILNGDIIDIWQFSKRYWPKSHMQLIKYIVDLIGEGVPVHYITGNHDEMLRKFVGLELGTFKISNKLILDLDGKKAWIFHGDVFDVTMKHSKWLAKLGAVGYDLLILINRMVNVILKSLGKDKISLSKRIKNGVKSAVKFINDFETTAAEIAISNEYDYVICGHIHQPIIKEIVTENGRTCYLNSGDWVENLTALEYHNGNWKIYNYYQDSTAMSHVLNNNDHVLLKSNELFENLLTEFKLIK
jgi:UDP-2,3-diacylglucosamine pyrophosphatase LpxH